VVVAVIAVWVVKPVAHHVIDMVAVGDRLMPTLRAVLMGRTVPRGSVCVLRRMLVVDINGMLVDMALVRMMQMALMQIVGVVTMAHSDMPAARPVGVRVILVFLTGHGSHDTAQCQRGLIRVRGDLRSEGQCALRPGPPSRTGEVARGRRLVERGRLKQRLWHRDERPGGAEGDAKAGARQRRCGRRVRKRRHAVLAHALSEPQHRELTAL
jgi:hypothetical protein